MKDLNIYMCGVGGQGIGLLAEVLIRACSAAGYDVKGVDTHGLAQRGGTVVSHLRIGKKVFSPLISPGKADIIIGLERLEAARSTAVMMKKGGKVLYYDAQYQTIGNRLGKFEYPSVEEFERSVSDKNGTSVRIYDNDLQDPRTQNILLLKKLSLTGWIEGLEQEHIENSLKELLQGKVLEKNLELIRGI